LKPNFKRIQIEASIISSGTDYEEKKTDRKTNKNTQLTHFYFIVVRIITEQNDKMTHSYS
jgi:hypothetical protein